ncbi:major facilitator superfamily domain-containing protein [Dichomitus squalens]|uniref:Major facilitator superfamily domain-containing protein n=1 Tax=Dichomitus squalens TaxID=114155 RepID=A0A4Q9M832_9APHY|nr:major facilitator superfamily domain-containing protein [Dichomitus squalens]
MASFHESQNLSEAASQMAEKPPQKGSVNDELTTKTNSPTTSSSFPEGGLRAWLTVLGGSMVVMCTFGIVQSFGVFQDYYTRVSLKEHSPSQISWIGSFQLFLLFAVALPSGRLYDEGFFRYLIACGSLLYLFSVFMLSLTKPHKYYETFLSQGLGVGLGMGLLFLPSLSISSQYFRARRSLAMGCVIAGNSAGFGWAVRYLCRLLLTCTGLLIYNIRAYGFISLLLLSLSFLSMKTRLPSRRERPDAPPIVVKPLLIDVPYMICVAGAFFTFWGLFFPFFYLQLYGSLHGVSHSFTIYIIPILNGASLFGRTIPNFLADYYGRFNVIIPMTTIAGLLMFAMFGAKTEHGIVAFAILYGFFSGCFLSMAAPMLTVFAKSVDEVGIRIGFACFIFSFALLTGNPISGALLRAPEYLWSHAIIFNAVMVLFGCFLLTVSRAMVAKAKGTQWV